MQTVLVRISAKERSKNICQGLVVAYLFHWNFGMASSSDNYWNVINTSFVFTLLSDG